MAVRIDKYVLAVTTAESCIGPDKWFHLLIKNVEQNSLAFLNFYLESSTAISCQQEINKQSIKKLDIDFMTYWIRLVISSRARL